MWAVLAIALQPYAKTIARYFVIDSKQSMPDMEDKMYSQIPTLSDAPGTGNDSSRRYLAETGKKNPKWSKASYISCFNTQKHSCTFVK